ncbi:MAG TPA: hypothetical protein VGW35_19010, partial [Methylomirabilota bacterium]|nr:hypothetical protein [Methylomirabilota bacterium]
TRTTLFSLFRRGLYYPIKVPKTYTWRDYGDIQWAEGMSAGHYDWVRAALKHYLKTGNLEALRWGMAAVRSAVSVDHAWASPKTPALNDWTNLAGFARYEKGNHGGVDFVARPTHSWLEGLFLAAALTGDPWVREAAIDMAEGDWRFWGGSNPAFSVPPRDWNALGGEVRIVGWPLLAQVVTFRETGDRKYWTKARELMDALLLEEAVWGQKGYIGDRSRWGYANNVYPLQHGYTAKGMLAFADLAMARGEWTSEYEALLTRWATWLTTPVPNGPYYPPTATTAGAFAFYWCPPGFACAKATSQPEVAYNALVVDLLAWLATRDPATWTPIARQVFRDYVYRSAHPDPAIVGFLTNQYPATETKILGWMQLFGDRAAQWCSSRCSPTRELRASEGPVGTRAAEKGGPSMPAARRPGV